MLAPGATFTTAGSTTAYGIGVDGTVHLPAGTTLDMAQVVGNDLHLMQPDGTLIVIVGAGVGIPLIFIGGVAFNPDVIAALVGLGQVQPAAAAAAAPGGVGGSAGGEFGQPAGPIDPNAINLTDLLPPTALQFGIPEIEEIGFDVDDEPTVSENPSVIADDDDLSGGNAGGVGDDAATNLSGVLAHDFGDNAPGTIGFLTSGAPEGFAYELSGSSLLILQNGTLVLTVTLDPATGAYTVTQNNPIDHPAGDNENNQDFTLTYRVTDSDGDFIDGTLNLSVDDDTPTVIANAAALVDDDNLAGGNPGGVGDDDPVSVSGTLGHSFGADGGSIAFLATGAPSGFTYETSGSSLLIKQGATLVLTITLNTATGAYSVIQNAPIDHAAGDNENNQAFTIGYRVTDGDGDTVDGSLSLSVDDDTPTVTLNTTAVLDDDQFAGGNPGGTGDDAIANTSGNIGFSFGADGPGSAAFLTAGAPAGFTYELSGGSLLIKQGGTTVLTVTLNDETGAYTVVQNAVIDHAAGGEENNSLFTLTYRVTDGDGDTVDGTLTISVDDDTPTVTSNAGVVVDEDDLPGGNGDNAAGDDAPANVTGTLGHSFGADGPGAVALLGSGAPAGFTYTLSNNGTVLTIGENSSGNDVVRVTVNAATGAYEVELLNPLQHPISGTEDNLPFTINYSVTDGDGDSTNGTLSISVDDDSPTSGGQQPRPISATVLEDGLAVASGDLSDGNREGGETTADDEASGAAGSLTGVFSVGADVPLTVTLSNNTSGLPTLFSKGDAITYSVTGNVLTATADSGGPDQRVVFTLTVNLDGSWSFDLKDQLDHVDNGLNDENFALRTDAGGTNSVGAIDFSSVILGTDNDGDTAPAASGSFTITVQDDIPAGQVSGSASVHVDEDDLSAGSGDLSTGITDGDADTDEATFSSVALAAVLTPGADEPVTLTLDGSVSGAVKTSGGDDVKSQGVTVKWAVIDATHIIGFADSNDNGIQDGGEREIFRVTDNGNGTFTFDLKDQIDHASASGDEAVVTLDLTDAFAVTDYDGDEVALGSGTITVEVENDIPQAVSGGVASIRVEEDELSTGTGDLSNGITDGDGFTDEATFSSADLTALVTPGADEPIDFNLNIGASGNVVTTGGTAVLSQGANVIWGTNAGALVGFVNLGGGAGFDLGTDREVFRLTDNGNGTFTFDLKDQFDHAPASTDTGTLTLDLTGAFSATDYDGDAVALNADSITVVVENDVPQAVSGGVASIRVEEDELSTGSGDLSNGITDGDAFTDEATFTSASLAALVTPGADEPIDFNLNIGASGNVVTTGGAAVLSQGANVIWGTNAGALVGFVNLGGGAGFDLGTDREVFRVTDNGNGTFTFDLKDQLDHTAAAGDNGILTLDLTGAFSATDYDGDAVTLNADSITVVVENDVPQAVSGGVASIRVEEDELSTGSGDLSNGITDGDAFGDEATFTSASLAALVTPGADEPIDFNLNIAASGNVVTTGGAAVLSQGANVIWGTNAGALVGFVNLGGGAGFDLGTDREVFRLTDNGNGTFTFDLKDQIDHTPAAGDDGILTLDLTGAFAATDYDGDAVALNADSITVVVENDVPAGVVSGSVSIRVEEDELSTGSGDLSNGITDGDAFGDEATFSSASFGAVVTPGADENIKFALNLGVSGSNVVTTGGAAVLSQGANVIWGTNAGALVGFVNLGGGAGFDLGIDREVFRVTDNGNGTFTFDLKDQLDHTVAAGDDGILTLDLSAAFGVTDFDGDAVPLASGSITVVVENDVPQIVTSGTASIRVDEDELSTGSGDLSNGITDGDSDTDEATFTSASLAALVTPGADEPIDFNLNIGASGNVVTTGGAAVLSQGANVIWGTNAGALVGFVNLGGGAGFDLGTDREVFRLTDNGNGTFTFDLKDQIDHTPAAGDDGILTLDLTGAFSATDYDGDAVTLNADSITVVVENDVPQAVSGGVASIRVEEDELSTGSGDLSNGITDGDAFGDEATFTSASLAALVTPGADEPLDFNLNTGLSGNVVTTGGAAVLSQGANVIWGTNAGALVGFVNLGGGAGFDLGTDREVFRVTDNGNGTFTFDLKDQLDHAAAAGDNGILTLDLTGAFSATDYDGDAVTLNADSITVVVENDIPAAVSGGVASIRVEEDDLSTGSGDLSNGITDGDAFGDEATFSSASLAALVTPGADEPTDFNLNTGVSGNVVTTGGAAVLSQGANVIWGTNAGALVGFVNLGGGAGFDLGTDREVFRVTDNGNGTFTFDLKDQLDHTPAAGDDGILTLDLTGAFSATDYDGDAVTLSPDSITVVVENDVPAAVSGGVTSIRVEEDELSTGSGDLSTGITDGDAFGDEATFTSASLAALVTPGADEPIDFNLNIGVSGNVVTTGGAAVMSQGANVIWGTNAGALVGFVNLGGGAGFDLGTDREVFRLTDNGNGTFTFDLKDQIDHAPASTDTGILTLDLTGAFSATDYDGDAVALNADSITVVVENDVPAAVSGGVTSIRVEEDELSTGSGDLSNGITDGDAFTDEATFTSASLAALVTPGADEPIDFNLNIGASGNVVTTGGTAVLSQGANVIWGTNAGALVGFVNLGGGAGFDAGTDREVFRLTDNANGTFTFDLKDQLDHATASGDNGILTLDLTGAFSATDFDGDAVILNPDSITVVVENDVPDAENDSNSALEGGPAVGGNVLTNDAFGADEGTVGANVRVSHIESDNVPANESNIGSGGNAVIAGQFGSLTLNANGTYSYTPNGSISGTGLDVFTYTLLDADGDTTTATLSITVEEVDLFPDAVQDNATVPEGGQTVNAAFVLDFSGSIDNNELNTQLDAVRAAGQAIFAAGTAIITIIIFSSTAADKGTFTDFASFEAAINAMNPLEPGGVRPTGIGTNTDFTAGIQLTMAEYVPFAGLNNQVFFISDGNPNEQLGTGGNSLTDATRTAWTNFVTDNDVNVTAIGVGNGIQIARLQDVDVDGTGAPIMVAAFDDLIDALLDVVGGDTSGNVLTNDTPGDGAITIVSIEVDGVVYTYNGTNIIPGNGDPTIAGAVLEIDTDLGGHLEFHFANGGGFVAGDWNYEAPGNVPGNTPVDETFTYVIRDADNDPDSADLVITVTPALPPDAANDTVRTNHVDGTFAIPFSALMANDTGANSTITGVTGATGGTVTLDTINQLVLFTPTVLGFPSGSFTYLLENADGQTDVATVSLAGVNAQQVNATAPGQILIGNEFALYFSITGAGDFGGLSGNEDDEEIFKWNGTTFSEYYGGGELSADGEDIDALYMFPSGGYYFSILGDNEVFNGVGDADNEDLIALFGPSDTTYFEVTFGGNDGNGTWSTTNLNSLFVFTNGNLLMSFAVATDPNGGPAVTYQPYELVLYNPTTLTFSEYADGMLSSGVIDAVDVLANGDVIFSLAADTLNLGGNAYEDSDLIRWDGTAYSKFFDGSDNGLADAGENIDGVSILGSDILVGGAGNDILFGLGGEDLLTGGAGNDTFVLTDALAADTITDYASGDAVDLSALLDQALIGGNPLSDFVKLTDTIEGRALQIDANGTAGGTSFTTVAIFSPTAPATVHILYDNAEANVPQT